MTDERWRPVRAGIRNVWEYDDQVFDFADGRLILRGPNGSGKSNALALLFPFLLEGTMSAAAMDPFAGGRSMRSLLLGVLRDDAESRRYRHDSRLGYVWLEFGRSVGTGTDRFLTVGCGARASTQSGDARSWFFVTERRVGLELDLAPGGELLTRAKLAEALSAEAVVESAEGYRALVDRALYELGPDRQQKLVSLIRVLRRPQLAGKLDLELLSQVLSSGLPALDDTVLDDVASSLDDLESTQRDLADIQAARATVDAFVPVYAAYLTGEVLIRAAAVTAGAQALRRAEGRVRTAATGMARVTASLDDNAAQRHEVALATAAADADRVAVLESPAFREATSLKEVDSSAHRAEDQRTGAARRRDEAAEQARRDEEEADQAERLAAERQAEADRALTEVLDAADAVDLAWTLTDDEARDPDRLASGAAVGERSRRDDLRVVRRALTDRDDARRDHDQAEQAASDALVAAREATTAAELADQDVVAERAGLARKVGAWVAAAPGLDADGRRSLVAAVADLGEPGAPGLADQFRSLTAPTRDRLVESRTRSADALAALDREVEELRDERRRVASEEDPGPATPAWRTAPRSTRAGAPLWACCDFADTVPEHQRAGLEAALDAAGLLDAWVSPEEAAPPGSLLDAWLVAGSLAPLAGGRPTLAEVFVPTVPEGSGLDTGRLTAALEAIGLGQVGVAVDGEGHFVLGPLRGRSGKDRPEFIGATARADRRRRQLAELEVAIDAVGKCIIDEVAERDRLREQIEQLEQAPATMPPTIELTRAVAAAHTARSLAQAKADVAADAQAQEALVAAKAEEADRMLTQQATSHRLTPDTEALDLAEQLVATFALATGRAVTVRRRADDGQGQATKDRSRATTAVAAMEDRRREWVEADLAASSLRSRADTLGARLGADAEEPLLALAGCEERLRDLANDQRGLEDTRAELNRQQGTVEEEAKEADRNRAAADEQLGELSRRLAVLRRSDLLAVVIEPQDDVELPREPGAFAAWLRDAVSGDPPSADEQVRRVTALDRAQKALLDDLHQGYDPSIAHDDGIATVQVSSEAGTFGLSVLATELARQDEQLQTYLSEGDREVFERFLLNRVSHELRRLLTDADEFVAGVNAALADAPTASGLRVELGWELDADDPGVRDAVRLLRRDTEQMGDEERAELRRFFERVIREQRAENPTAGYRIALEAALDYRAWHEFRPYLRGPEGARIRLTRMRFRELSGGEQAVALHLPLFAAAAAHYARANPLAPRLVALDEAFAGIDEAMRGELMGLTVAFDLDLIMTGHELWGAYAEVPAVAVHDLLRRPPAEGVSVFSLRWDGEALTEPTATR